MRNIPLSKICVEKQQKTRKRKRLTKKKKKEEKEDLKLRFQERG